LAYNKLEYFPSILKSFTALLDLDLSNAFQFRASVTRKVKIEEAESTSRAVDNAQRSGNGYISSKQEPVASGAYRQGRLWDILKGLSSLSKLTKLNLSHSSLSEFPQDGFILPHLEDLNLSNNNLLQLPNLNFPRLRRLDMNANRIASLDFLHSSSIIDRVPEFPQMQFLDEVSIKSIYPLTFIFNVYVDEKNFKVHCSHNAIIVVSLHLLALPRLRLVDLSDNPIKSFEDELTFDLNCLAPRPRVAVKSTMAAWTDPIGASKLLFQSAGSPLLCKPSATDIERELVVHLGRADPDLSPPAWAFDSPATLRK
jgi:Leucine-rich repeat (LRR) protein